MPQVEPDAAEPELVAQLALPIVEPPPSVSAAMQPKNRGTTAACRLRGGNLPFVFANRAAMKPDGHDDDEVQRDDDVVDRR